MAALALAALLTMASFSEVFAVTDYVFISVNGDTTATAAVQGDLLNWGSNCAVGANVQWDIWADLNLNSIIDEGLDYLVVSYVATDGNTDPDGPPPDSDPIPDGWYITMPFVVGLAPTIYIFRATDLSDMTSAERAILMQALGSPPNQISGTITLEGVTPPDNLLQNIWVQAESDSGGFQIWSAFTDNTGAFTINIGAAGSGITFDIYPGNVQGFVTPPEQYVVANGVVSGIDFVYGAPADSVYGYVLDSDSNPIAPVEIWCSPVGGSGGKYYDSYDGYYVIYFTSAELGEWWLGVSDNIDPQYMVPQSYYFDNSVLHSFQHDMVCPLADTVINFTLTEDGGLPSRQYRVQAFSNELGAFANKITSVGDSGIYQIGVSSDQSAGYNVMVSTWDDRYPIPPGYAVVGNYFGVMPGDMVSFNITQGKQVCGNVYFDAGDETVPFSQVEVRLNGVNGNSMVHPASDGSYLIAADTGFYSHSVYAATYLSTPATYSLQLTNDTCGFSFTMNKQHQHIIGQLTGVTLPLSGNYWVSGSTQLFPLGYNVSSEQVVNATGEFHIYVCDGNWTFYPPTIPGYPTPAPQVIMVSENRDTTINLIFDYTQTYTVIDTVKVDPDDPLPNPNDVTVWVSDGVNTYSAHPDINGIYTISGILEGNYQISLNCPGYLSTPDEYHTMINTNLTGAGFDFFLNRQHCLIDGHIQDVSLPLGDDYFVFGGTDIYPNGYHVTSNFVDRATGNWSLYLCDGTWTLFPPDIPGYDKPDSVILIIGESPDDNRTVNFVYSITSYSPQEQEIVLPQQFFLNQNHPNPFNAGTSIGFELPARSEVNITVYNILGQPVAVVADGIFPAGSHTVEWNGKSENGTELSSGIYFYRMSAGQNVFVKKMVVLK
jgi:hypothetical protein